MAKIDLTDNEYKIIKDLLNRYIPNILVWAYGSRVKGTSTKYSDLDMVVFSSKKQNLIISDLKTAFEESNLPFKVDLFAWTNIPEQFYENIKKEHIVLQNNQQPKTYVKYKDSGIEWIGEIPQGWSISKIKYISEIYTGNSISDSEKESYTIQENSIPYISTKDIELKTNKISYDNGLYVPLASNFKVAPINSVLLCIEGGSAGKKIGFTKHAVCFVNKLCCFTEKATSSATFLYYAFQSDMFLIVFNLRMSGLIGGVSIGQIKNISIPLPPLLEQKQISDYLNKKCGAIDGTIEKEQLTIQKLKEYKQSLITETVTKGLDKNASMKDSGIEWIGEIPQHWEVKKLFKIYRERKCKNKGNLEKNVLSLSYGNIKRRNIETNIGLLPESFETYNIIESNNIVLRLTDLQNDHKSLRCGLAEEKGIITSAYVTLELIDIKNNSNYFYRLLHTFDTMKGFYRMGDGVRQNLKYNDELCNLLITYPPLQEQKQISDYLDKKCGAIDETVTQKERLIEKLIQYKKSLIYEYVTGKRMIIYDNR